MTITLVLGEIDVGGPIATSPESAGGGIYANSGSLALTHCTLNGNAANSGGSIYTEVGDAVGDTQFCLGGRIDPDHRGQRRRRCR